MHRAAPMAWQHPFITIDQNQLRHPDAISRLLDDCCRNELRLLLPDGAFLEFSKGGAPLETARHSLCVLAPYRELVCSSRKIAEMLRDELQRRAPCVSLVQEESTRFLRSILEELEHGDETKLRELVDGPIAELMPPALEVWNDHKHNRLTVHGLHDALKGDISASQLKALRRSPEYEVSKWLSSADGMRFVYRRLKDRGADGATAYELMRTPSVSAGFLSAMVALAAYWLAFGGLATAAAKEFSGDLLDMEYVILGALSRSLATADRRASLICQAVASAFEARRSLPCITNFDWDSPGRQMPVE